MTTSTRDLADQAQVIARKSEGVQRQAANCVTIALSYSTSLKSAREALQEVGRPDVRTAALQLLDELPADMAAPT